MSKKLNFLGYQGEVGGPEEDRTPDLLIANDTTINDINNLDRCCVAINGGKTGGECTERAQVGSVLQERPGATQKPLGDTGPYLLIAMGLAVAILVGVGIANWLSKKVERGSSNGSDI